MTGVTAEQIMWRDRAACLGMDTGLFFPARGENAAEAKQVCAACPVIVECREWALSQGPKLVGVYAGLTGRDRRPLHKARNRVERRAYPRDYGMPRIPNGPTRAHLGRLIAAGWTHVRIAEATGVSWQTVTAQLRPSVGLVDAGFAETVAGLSDRPGRPLCCGVCGGRMGVHPLEGHLR